MRIVSLIASATEIVHALGFGDALVGRSHECDFPPSVTALPRLTEPKFPVEGSSYDIDQRVKAILQEGLSVYRVDAAALAALRPDIIVTQTQCEVCAVSEKDVEDAVCSWVESRPKIISLKPDALVDVWADIRRVGEALGARGKAEELVGSLQDRIGAIARKAGTLPAKPSVAYVEWIDPLMAGGNWMPELIERAGGKNLFGSAGRHSPWLEWDSLRTADPEVIFVAPCGFDLPRTRTEMASLVARPGWENLRAVRSDRVFFADGNRFFNRPGPRLVESLEILAETLHPEAFSFGHEGDGWERFRT